MASSLPSRLGKEPRRARSPMKRAYVKSWTISLDGTVALEEVIQARVKEFNELVLVAPVDDDPLVEVARSDLLDN